MFEEFGILMSRNMNNLSVLLIKFTFNGGPFQQPLAFSQREPSRQSFQGQFVYDIE